MGICPTCGQSTKGNTVFKCKDCGKVFCSRCRENGGTSLARLIFGGTGICTYRKPKCPGCGSVNVKSI